jgi:cell division protein ZapA
MKDSSSRVVTVEIQGQRYPIRSQLDAAYVAELAAYVDEKMRIAARETSTADSLKVAVVAALNIADEFFRARAQQSSAHGEINERALQLEQLVDEALAQLPIAKAVSAS